MKINRIGRSATEASGITALAVGVSFLFSGAFLSATISLAIGIVLVLVYEFLGLGRIYLTEKEIKQISEKGSEEINELLEEIEEQ